MNLCEIILISFAFLSIARRL